MSKNIRIGITERGDAGIDLSWYDKIKNGACEGAILITKNITDEFIKNVLDLYNTNHKIIVHCSCTGWGKTVLEPNVPEYKTQLNKLKELIDKGFPIKNCVLRIDPIFPTKSGLQRVCDVLSYATELNLIPTIRIRVSIYDEYKHVKERLKEHGIAPMYGDSFYAQQKMMNDAIDVLTKVHEEYANKFKENVRFETCAEPFLKNPNVFKQTGCVSGSDLDIFGLKTDTNLTNLQNRHGCMCLGCKKELLTNKKQCPHKCLYCYWRD